jgi:hypothetical protein
MHEPDAEYLSRWKEYRRLRMTLLALICGWVPFGLLIGYVLPLLFGTYIATYVAAAMYGVALMVSWLRYAFYSCPSCGTSLRGSQFYREKCRECGELINRSVQA